MWQRATKWRRGGRWTGRGPSRWGIGGGSLQIGDVAVVVATSGAHRGDTFAATRDLIDTLKAEVPIWKRQRFDDGDQEWVGTP